MDEEQERVEGKLLSKFLLIKSEINGINKSKFGEEMKILTEGIESRINLIIKNLFSTIKSREAMKGGKLRK